MKFRKLSVLIPVFVLSGCGKFDNSPVGISKMVSDASLNLSANLSEVKITNSWENYNDLFAESGFVFNDAETTHVKLDKENLKVSTIIEDNESYRGVGTDIVTHYTSRNEFYGCASLNEESGLYDVTTTMFFNYDTTYPNETDFNEYSEAGLLPNDETKEALFAGIFLGEYYDAAYEQLDQIFVEGIGKDGVSIDHYEDLGSINNFDPNYYNQNEYLTTVEEVTIKTSLTKLKDKTFALAKYELESKYYLIENPNGTLKNSPELLRLEKIVYEYGYDKVSVDIREPFVAQPYAYLVAFENETKALNDQSSEQQNIDTFITEYYKKDHNEDRDVTIVTENLLLFADEYYLICDSEEAFALPVSNITGDGIVGLESDPNGCIFRMEGYDAARYVVTVFIDNETKAPIEAHFDFVCPVEIN